MFYQTPLSILHRKYYTLWENSEWQCPLYKEKKTFANSCVFYNLAGVGLFYLFIPPHYVPTHQTNKQAIVEMLADKQTLR